MEREGDGLGLCDAKGMFEQPASSGQLPVRGAALKAAADVKEFRRSL
jgi:hypothetical protein